MTIKEQDLINSKFEYDFWKDRYVYQASSLVIFYYLTDRVVEVCNDPYRFRGPCETSDEFTDIMKVTKCDFRLTINEDRDTGNSGV